MNYRSYPSRSRTGSFHFRLRLPAHLAASSSVRELRRSLATKDVIEARRRALEAFQAVHRAGQGADDPAAALQILDGLLLTWRPRPQPVVAPVQTRTIKAGIEHFLLENAHLWTPKTAQEMKAVLSRLSIERRFGREEAIAHKETLVDLHPRTPEQAPG
jgi:hypothetical protein